MRAALFLSVAPLALMATAATAQDTAAAGAADTASNPTADAKASQDNNGAQDVIVTGFSAEDNLYLLSIPGGSIVAGNSVDIAEGSLVEARITGSNTGGLECEVGSTRGFKIGRAHV